MPNRNQVIEDVKLQFARQLYSTFLERNGADDDQTGILRDYIAALERRQLQREEAWASSVTAA